MVNSDVMKMTATYSAMIGHLFDTIIVIGPSKFKNFKVLEIVVSLLKFVSFKGFYLFFFLLD